MACIDLQGTLSNPNNLYKTRNWQIWIFTIHKTEAMKKIFQLLFHAYVCLCACFISHGCLLHERDALLLFKQNITPSPAAQLLPSWSGNTDCCHDWPEVTCTSSSRVQALHLHSLGLNNSDGSFLHPLSTLQELSYLDMSDNTLNISAVLHALSEFPSLTHLNLRNLANQMVTDMELDNLQLRCGTPENNTVEGIDFHLWNDASLAKLKYLDLSWNNIHGKALAEVNKMSSLKYLDLSHNCLVDISMETSAKKTRGLSSLTHLDLSYNNLNVSTSLFLEKILDNFKLEYLNLSNTYLFGNMPFQLWGMSSLVSLDLSNTSMYLDRVSESIPYLYNVKYLHLDGVNMSMTTAKFWEHSLANLSQLEELHAKECSISENMERMQGLGRLHKLKYLDMSSNEIKGGLPEFIGQMESIEYMDLSENSLDGEVHFSIPESLRSLYLSGNALTGTITESFFGNAAGLSVLSMGGNNLSFNISTSWIPPFSLKELYIASCKINGPFPPWLSTQPSITKLSMPNTDLQGNLPTWFPELLKSLEAIDLCNNNLEGNLPYLTGDSQVLSFCNNKFTGTLQIGSLPFLAYLDLSNNNIQGNIPGNLDDTMPGIQILILKNNKFTGHLPQTIQNCILLQQLEVGNNYLEGEFPNYLLGMQYLMILQMSSNRFHGRIPKDINTMSSLRILDLSNNRFSGNIPANISKLPSFHEPVEDVYLQFSTEIFNKGHFMSYEVLPPNMESIDLSGNLLGGEIPRDIGELTALKQLNLSRNHLVGSIPDSITMLQELESLDMSSNQLTGVIPPDFVRMNALEVLDMSYNNLSGFIPRGGQMLTFPDSFLGNPHLKDTLLPASRSQQQPGETQESVLEESDSSEFWWKLTVGLSFGVGFGGFYLVSSVSHKFRKKLCKFQDSIMYRYFVI